MGFADANLMTTFSLSATKLRNGEKQPVALETKEREERAADPGDQQRSTHRDHAEQHDVLDGDGAAVTVHCNVNRHPRSPWSRA